jgi:hypothetical protein
MNANKRPLAVTILACLYLTVGALGFVFHFKDSLAHPSDGIWIELTEFLAIICGAFLLRGQNWARWLALAWMAFHVFLSADVRQVAVHGLFLAVIAWLLFRPEARRYFRGARAECA